MEAGRDYQNVNLAAAFSGYPTPKIAWYDADSREILASQDNNGMPKNSLYSGGIDQQSGLTSWHRNNKADSKYYVFKVYTNYNRTEKKIWVVDYVVPFEFKIFIINETDTSIGIQCNITGHPTPNFFNLEACFKHSNGSSYCDREVSSLNTYRVSNCIQSTKLPMPNDL